MKKNNVPSSVGQYYTRFPYEDNLLVVIRNNLGVQHVCKADDENPRLLRVVADCGYDEILAAQVAALIVARGV